MKLRQQQMPCVGDAQRQPGSPGHLDVAVQAPERLYGHLHFEQERAGRDVTPATPGRLRLVRDVADEAEGATYAARMYVAADGGPIRTVVGDYHRHQTGEEQSVKTGLSNPYEGPTEHALIVESSLRGDVPDFRSQAFRLELLVGGSVRSWICDHLRQVRRDGFDHVEAIECKPDVSYMDADERAVHAAAAEVVRGLGWHHRIVYLDQVRGSGERQINFGEIYAHQTTNVPEDRVAVFERMCVTTPAVTFRDLRTALDPNRIKGTAMAHALICQGRVQVDLDRYLFDPSPVHLLPAVRFEPRIRF
jgi:hypothetical protein